MHGDHYWYQFNVFRNSSNRNLTFMQVRFSVESVLVTFSVSGQDSDINSVYSQFDMMPHGFNLSTREAEAGRSVVQGQSGLYRSSRTIRTTQRYCFSKIQLKIIDKNINECSQFIFVVSSVDPSFKQARQSLYH